MNNLSTNSRTVVLLGTAARPVINFRGDLIRRMTERGDTVVVACPNDHDIESALDSLGARWVRLPMGRSATTPSKDLFASLRILRLLRAERPDVLLTYTAKAMMLSAIPLLMVPSVRGLGIVTGLGELRERLGSRLIRTMLRVVFRAYDRVVFHNPDDMASCVKPGLVSNERSFVVLGSGVDVERFAQEPLPQRLSCPTRFLFVGRLSRAKGVPELFEAATLLRERGIAADVQLLGRTDGGVLDMSDTELRTEAERAGANLRGWVDDVREEVVASHVVVLPSHGEGLPRSLLEALATGRPVITTDVPGCRQVVVDGDCGLLVPPSDPIALAEAMEKLATGCMDLDSLGSSGRRRAVEVFSTDVINTAMLGHLDAVHHG